MCAPGLELLTQSFKEPPRALRHRRLLAATTEGIYDVESGDAVLTGVDVGFVSQRANETWALAGGRSVHRDSGAGWTEVAHLERGTGLVAQPLDDGRLLIGTLGGIWRGVTQGFQYDATSGASTAFFGVWSIEADLGVPTPPESGMVFRIYPRPTGLLGKLSALSGGLDASLGLFGRIESLLNLPAAQAILEGVADLPGQTPGSTIQLKAAHLPRP